MYWIFAEQLEGRDEIRDHCIVLKLDKINSLNHLRNFESIDNLNRIKSSRDGNRPV